MYILFVVSKKCNYCLYYNFCSLTILKCYQIYVWHHINEIKIALVIKHVVFSISIVRAGIGRLWVMYSWCPKNNRVDNESKTIYLLANNSIPSYMYFRTQSILDLINQPYNYTEFCIQSIEKWFLLLTCCINHWSCRGTSLP